MTLDLDGGGWVVDSPHLLIFILRTNTQDVTDLPKTFTGIFSGIYLIIIIIILTLNDKYYS